MTMNKMDKKKRRAKLLKKATNIKNNNIAKRFRNWRVTTKDIKKFI